jgi:(p)ppGpp synthase/HD superfamily hydrolase
MAAVGRGELASADVIRAMFPGEKPQEAPKRRRKVKRNDEGWFGLRKVMGLKFRWPGSGERPREEDTSGIPIRGLRGDLPVSFAEGGAVPGDRIVGILTPGQGITIYPIHAEALKAFDEEPERWIDVTWDIDEDNPQRFPAKLAVTALNEPGSLAQVATVIGEADGNIDNIKMTNRVADYTEMLIDLEVWDLKHLNDIIAGLRAKDVVSSAARASA